MNRARQSLLTVALLAVILSSAGAAAHAASTPSGVQPGANCSNTSSAINQYCEDIPSASGGGTPPPGTAAPQVGTALPQSAVRALNHLPAARRTRALKLLSLPAPAASVPVTGSLSAHHGAWSLPIGLVLAMVAIAAVCAGAAILGGRRRGSGPATEA